MSFVYFHGPYQYQFPLLFIWQLYHITLAIKSLNKMYFITCLRPLCISDLHITLVKKWHLWLTQSIVLDISEIWWIIPKQLTLLSTGPHGMALYGFNRRSNVRVAVVWQLYHAQKSHVNGRNGYLDLFVISLIVFIFSIMFIKMH